MKTKEAIWLIEDLRDDYYEIDEYCEMVNDFDQVIFLLQQGEAYKQLVEEIRDEFGNGILENENGIGVQLKNLIEILEQKYSPKEAKSDGS